MKSPLKNTHFDSVSLNFLKTIVDRGQKVQSHFMFSGQLELGLARYDRFVNARTSLPFLYEFWRCIETDPVRVHDIVAHEAFTFEDQTSFTILQDSWHTYENPYVRAALFFLLNRCSDSGQISSGRLSMENYTVFALNALKTFKAPPFFHIEYTEEEEYELHQEFDYRLLSVGSYRPNLLEDSQVRAADRYLIDHTKVNALLREDVPTIALYNKSELVIETLNFCSLTMIDSFGNTTPDFKQCEEIVVTNF